MYEISYEETLEDSPKDCRDRERLALDRVILLLEAGAEAGAGSKEATDALLLLNRLWRAFIEDLASPDNDLPDGLRGDLLSVGLWIIKEADAILVSRSKNFRGLIEICTIIRDGLK
jgi:flagellar protein FlaF